MGIFRSSDPHNNVWKKTGGLVQTWRFEPDKRLLLHVSHSWIGQEEIDSYEIPFKQFTFEFQKMVKRVIGDYNSRYEASHDSGTHGDYVSIPEYPNYIISVSDNTRPFAIIQRPEDIDEEKNLPRKCFDLLLFADCKNFGQLSLAKFVRSTQLFMPAVDLRSVIKGNIGFALWNMCGDDSEENITVHAQVRFTAGKSGVDSVQIGLPNLELAGRVRQHLNEMKLKAGT